MRTKASVNLSMFLAIGFLLVAWRIAPIGDAYWQHWLITGLFAIGGADGIVRSIRLARSIEGPRPKRRTPPLWAVAWMIVLVLALSFGTPHLRMIYGPQGCLYVGWNGSTHLPAYPCRIVELVPLW